MVTERAWRRGTEVIRIRRTFGASRAVVFRQWTVAEELGAWFAPGGYRTTHCEVDARVGGRWHVRFESASGEAHEEFGEFLEMSAPVRLVFTLTQRDGRGHHGPETVVTVEFHEAGSGTELVFEQTGYDSKEMRDNNAIGWNECLDELARRVS